MRVPRGSVASVVVVAIGALIFAGCGAAQTVRPRAIAFEPTIIACSGSPAECPSVSALRSREAREASNYPCPPNKPYVLIKANGTLVCVAKLPSAGPPGVNVSIPGAVRGGGAGAVGEFRAGEAVAATFGCLACRRLAGTGNDGPGQDLTHVGSHLSPKAIERALVASPAPMPPFRHLPRARRRALVYFLAQLRRGRPPGLRPQRR
ncbi:MAG: hypothetical protein KGJ43_01155 [Acidobacteriota bacterium]|nr:hypothetical protein [Acidobacteriota bacterium]